MKYYKLTVVIREGYDEFWSELETASKSGVDEVVAAVKEALGDWDAEVTMSQFTQDTP